MLGHDLRFEAAFAVTRNLDRQFAELALECLAAAAVASVAAGVAAGVGHRRMPFMAQVRGHLHVQCPLDQSLGQLLQQAVLANQVLGLLVAGQQLIQQLVGNIVFACAYGVSG